MDLATMQTYSTLCLALISLLIQSGGDERTPIWT